MSRDNDELPRNQVTLERRDRRQKHIETKRLKRQRRLARRYKKGWNEAFLLENELNYKNLAAEQRKRARASAAQEVADAPQETREPSDPVEFLPENTLRIAVVGCGGWFCNRVHLPALAKIMRKSRVCLTVLCASEPSKRCEEMVSHSQQGRLVMALLPSLIHWNHPIR